MKNAKNTVAASDAVVVLNNTGMDIRMVEAAIIEAAKSGGALPEELADIFSLREVHGNDLANSTGRRCWAVEFA